MKKSIAMILVFSLLLVTFASCATDEPSSPPVPSSSAAPVSPDNATPVPSASDAPVSPEIVSPDASGADTQSFTDSVGRTVELPAKITKISPTGALAQMFLIAIAPDLLCTVASQYSESDLKYVPSYLNDLPEVGQFYGTDDINFESIAAINPEVVVDLGEPKDTIVEDMDSITEKLAIPAIHITADLRGTPDAFRTLGKLLGREERGEELAVFCETVLSDTDALVSSAADKPDVIYLAGDGGTNVLAFGTMHTEVLDYVAENIAVMEEPSSRGTGNETDLEQITVWNPEIIIFSPDSVYSEIADDPTWSQLDAVKNGKYVETPYGPYNWFGSPPSINRYLSMIWLSNLLYSDAAAEDAYGDIAEYYNLFYGYELTRAEYDELTVNAYFKG